MARGGYRPGSGRPKGVKNKTNSSSGISTEKKEKEEKGAKTAKNASKIKKSTSKNAKNSLKTAKNASKTDKIDEILTESEKKEAKEQGLTPLEYMLKIMNNSKADKDRRDRMAIAAAPYVHGRVEKGGKKKEKEQRAKAASSGRFAPAVPPKLTTVQGGK